MSTLLPLYQQVRRVRACKIKAIEQTPAGWIVHPEEQYLDPFPVHSGFIQNQRPMAGGYLTVQDNGQMRYVNAAEFEAAHVQVDALHDRRDELLRALSQIDTAIKAHQRT